MSVMRKALLAASTNPWLRDHVTKWGFVRRSVTRFMPGERIEDAIQAAKEQQKLGINTILTRLGENLTKAEEFEEVTQHYLEVLDKVKAAGLDAHISIKPTQLGLDLDRALCERNMDRLVERADELGNFVWIDMEGSPYVDPTIEIFKRSRAKSARVGIAIQAYLFRTPKDIEAMIPLGPAVRIVKGAYLEPPDVAYPKKSDVDEAFYALCTRLMAADAQQVRDAAAHRHARHPARRAADGLHQATQRPRVGLRVRDALRHPTPAAAAPGDGRAAPARPHQLRRVLVPVVHAPPGGATGERVVRGQDDVRVAALSPA